MRRGFDDAAVLRDLGFDHGFGTRDASTAELAPLALARQVHGEAAREVSGGEAQPEADALFTSAPGLAVGVWTADCVPILLAERSGRVVSAIHAGWRGSALQIAGKTVATLGARYAVDPADWIAVIGPHIGPCCYEVDEPVREAIAAPAAFSKGRRPGHYQLDLHALNRSQLLGAGLPPAHVVRVGGCTACDPGRYWSFRRAPGPGRMVHYIRKPAAQPSP